MLHKLYAINNNRCRIKSKHHCTHANSNMNQHMINAHTHTSQTDRWDPKAFMANERTFYHWLRFALSLCLFAFALREWGGMTVVPQLIVILVFSDCMVAYGVCSTGVLHILYTSVLFMCSYPYRCIYVSPISCACCLACMVANAVRQAGEYIHRMCRTCGREYLDMYFIHIYMSRVFGD